MAKNRYRSSSLSMSVHVNEDAIEEEDGLGEDQGDDSDEDLAESSRYTSYFDQRASSRPGTPRLEDRNPFNAPSANNSSHNLHALLSSRAGSTTSLPGSAKRPSAFLTSPRFRPLRSRSSTVSNDQTIERPSPLGSPSAHPNGYFSQSASPASSRGPSPAISRNTSSADLAGQMNDDPGEHKKKTLVKRLLAKRTKSSQPSKPETEQQIDLPPIQIELPQRPRWQRHTTSPDAFLQVPVSPPESETKDDNLFDSMLPHEIRLRIFKTVLHSIEHERPLDPNARWVGRPKALRELVRLSSVSKTWAALALDGQIWNRLDVGEFGPDSVSCGGLLAIARSSGTFLRHLNMRGYAGLENEEMLEILEACSIRLQYTRQNSLTSLNLAGKSRAIHLMYPLIWFPGCRKLEEPTLNEITGSSPFLSSVDFRSLPGVTDKTIILLFETATCISTLDVSRCPNLTATALVAHQSPSPHLKSLSAARISHMEEALPDLFFVFPSLLHLDVSGCALTDATFTKLVNVKETHLKSGSASARWSFRRHQAANQQATVSVASDEKRRIPLQSLNISSCTLLSDETFVHLSDVLPDLSTLEAANIRNLRDRGLVQFIKTVPMLKNLDLEGAAEITDAVLVALTPPANPLPGAKWPGLQLERLTVSYASHLSENAFLRLIKQCPRLTSLVADNTRITERAQRDFIYVARDARKRGAELCMIDCRGQPRTVDSAMAGVVRPRKGLLGWRYKAQEYFDNSRLREFDESRSVSSCLGGSF